uniref:DNA-directed RNA polymerase subunit n=1 Tax=Nephromyces sp. ex Molgula occidentalis TaxID=2544991 RepID=A0A5C1H8I6_9APIC|nr:plastid-encoded DNA-directed RNA polymerase beta' [Nephromyces sp. ex Molgula occidentalis]
MTIFIPSFKLSLSSPEQICLWWKREINGIIITGEVTEPLTINFKKKIYENNGLFCERIFGPTKSWSCLCGLYKGFYFNKFKKGSFCEKCGYELNDNRLRRYRFGFIKLNTPILNIWYLKGPGQILSTLLNTSVFNLEQIIYYKKFFLKNTFLNNFKTKSFNQIITSNNFIQNLNQQLPLTYSQLLLANELIYKILQNINLLTELSTSRENLLYENKLKNKTLLTKKARILHLFFISNIRPEWVFLKNLPIIPPELRPFTQLEKSNNFVISPLNNIYRLIIIRNNKLKRWVQLRNFIPLIFELIEKRMLQEIIDTLFDISIQKNIKERPNISLSTFLKGKTGHFRQNLLGKRVDFSGRAVIVSGSDLTIGKIGLPYELAFNLFNPILINILKNHKKINNFSKSLSLLQYRSRLFKQILKQILIKKTILLNRAPTLHKMNIQAFKPYLVEGNALRLFPLSCSSFNADFDGDQMGIFLPISNISQYEAKYKLSSEKNFFSFEKNKNLFKMSQSLVLGLSFLNIGLNYLNYGNFYFNTNQDILYSYFNKLLELNSYTWVKFKTIIDKQTYLSFKITTPGKILINEYLNSTSF